MSNLLDQIDEFYVSLSQGRALEIQRLLTEGADPDACVFGQNNRPLIYCATGSRPECVRLLIEAGADLQLARSERISLQLFFGTFYPGFTSRPAEQYLGEVILTLDLLMYYEPTFCSAATERPNTAQTTGEYIAERLRSTEHEQGTRMYREREGMLSLLQGRYWQAYGGRNPFLDANTAEEMMLLLMDGAANNEDGQTDMTRLRSIRPVLRRNVMELLRQFIDERRSLAVLHVAVANNKAHGPISCLSGLEKAIFPIIADFLGVRGSPFVNARNALAVFNQLVSGRFESEYNAGEW